MIKFHHIYGKIFFKFELKLIASSIVIRLNLDIFGWTVEAAWGLFLKLSYGFSSLCYVPSLIEW